MGLTTLTPLKRTAAGLWLNWAMAVLATSATNDHTGANYPGGIVPSGDWGKTGAAANLTAALVPSDGSYVTRFGQGIGIDADSPFLKVIFAPITDVPAGAVLQHVTFFVRRAGATLNTTTDLAVYMVKSGAYLTAQNKAIGTAWWPDQTNLETVQYDFTAADLATLGVTLSDLASNFGIGIRVTQTLPGPAHVSITPGDWADTTGAYIDSILCQVAYSILDEEDVAESEIPYASGASSWLRLWPMQGTVPPTNTVNGIEFDILAYTPNAHALAQMPMKSTDWAAVGADPNATSTCDVDAGGGWVNAGSLLPGQHFDLSSTPTTFRTWLTTRDFSDNNPSGSGFNFPFDQSGGWDYETLISWPAAPVISVEPTMPRFASWATDFSLHVTPANTPAPNARPTSIVGIWKPVGITPGLNEASAFFIGFGANNLTPPFQDQTYVLWLRWNFPVSAGTTTGDGGGPIVPDPGPVIGGGGLGGGEDMPLDGEPLAGGGIGGAPSDPRPTVGTQIAHFTLLKWTYQPSILECALSIDGSSPIGDTWYVFLTSTSTLQTCGGPSNLWGRINWPPIDFTGPFSLLIRRPAASKAVSSQYATFARARVTHTPNGGSLMSTPRQELTEIVLLGTESVAPGTLASSFIRLRALNYKSRPNFTMHNHRPQGEKMVASSLPVREWGTGAISGILDFSESPIPFEAIYGAGLHSGGTANQRNVHTYYLDNRRRSTIKTYSLQRGEKGTRAHQNRYLVHDAFNVSINTSQCQVSGGFFSRGVEDGITFATAPNAVQTVQFSGTPTSGSAILSYRGQEFTVAYNATGAAFTTALEAIVGAGNVVATLASMTYTVTFQGALAGTVQPLIRKVSHTFAGGTTPDVVVTQTTAGDYVTLPLVPVEPGYWNIYLADTQAGLDAGKLDAATAGVAATGFEVGDRHNPFFTLDRAGIQSGSTGLTFTDTVESDPKFTANLTVAANSTGMALLTTIRSGLTKWMRLEAVGPLIGVTAYYHKFVVEGAVKVADGADFGNEDGRVVFPWPLVFTEGPNGEVPTLVIENGVVSY